jgi:hypothetical protein
MDVAVQAMANFAHALRDELREMDEGELFRYDNGERFAERVEEEVDLMG